MNIETDRSENPDKKRFWHLFIPGCMIVFLSIFYPHVYRYDLQSSSLKLFSISFHLETSSGLYVYYTYYTVLFAFIALLYLVYFAFSVRAVGFNRMFESCVFSKAHAASIFWGSALYICTAIALDRLEFCMDDRATTGAAGITEIPLAYFFMYRVVLTGFLGPIFEEVFFRYILFRQLISQYDFNPFVSAMLSSLLFSIYHVNMADSMYYYFELFISGLLLCLFYRRSNCIIVPIVIHLIYNNMNTINFLRQHVVQGWT